MVIGITGGYCTGKTQVANIFRKFGAKIIDLDRLAHKALNTKACSKKIIKEFGNNILVNNRIDRHLLADCVFGNKKKLAKLNSIIHPVVIKEMVYLIRNFKKKFKFIVVEAPLLFEARIENYFDFIVVVKADRKTQIARATIKTDFSKKDIINRIHSQMPLRKKISRADFVIDNNGSIKETHRQTREIIKQLTGQMKTQLSER